MGLVAEFIGGRVDGELREVESPPPHEYYFAIPPVVRFWKDPNAVLPVEIGRLRYVRKRGWDGELLYVWDKIV